MKERTFYFLSKVSNFRLLWSLLRWRRKREARVSGNGDRTKKRVETKTRRERKTVGILDARVSDKTRVERGECEEMDPELKHGDEGFAEREGGAFEKREDMISDGRAEMDGQSCGCDASEEQLVLGKRKRKQVKMEGFVAFSSSV